LREVQQISAAWVYLAQGRLEQALAAIDQILGQAEAAGRMAHVIESTLLKALVFQAQKEAAKATRALQKAISFAAPEGCIRIFLEGGRPVGELLHLIASEQHNRRYVKQLLAAFNERTTTPEMKVANNVKRTMQNALVEPLSERECEVLKLIAAGYTNQQVADALVVSLNTVKKHTTHIYGKLGVQNRTEASNRARELGLA
jgi:LuxR family maltose regulon positive regulatory protein